MNRELLLELKEFLAERMVDNMTTEQLAEYVQDDLFTYFDKQGEHDFLEEAENYWGDYFGEVIDVPSLSLGNLPKPHSLPISLIS